MLKTSDIGLGLVLGGGLGERRLDTSGVELERTSGGRLAESRMLSPTLFLFLRSAT